jgi:hypothetical protein
MTADDRPATESRQLIASLLGPAEPELTCEQCFEQLDRYVDLQLAGDDADRSVPGMRAHLVGCPACLEDHASLLAFTASDDGEGAAPPA